MSSLKITVGGDVMNEARRDFIDAWHRAERGEDFCEQHLAFENWNTLMRVLTPKRAELIGHIRRHEVTNIQQLATALGRNDSDVRADVEALATRGLLDTSGGQIRAGYETIEAKVTF